MHLKQLSAGSRLKEGCHINRSLLTFGTVMQELSKGRQGHVNYGDHKPNTLSLDFINYVEAEVSRLKQRLRQEVASATPAAVSGLPINEIPDLFASTYSDVPLLDLQPKEILGLRWPEQSGKLLGLIVSSLRALDGATPHDCSEPRRRPQSARKIAFALDKEPISHQFKWRLPFVLF